MVTVFDSTTRSEAAAVYPQLIPLFLAFNSDQRQRYKESFGFEAEAWQPSEAWFLEDLEEGFYLVAFQGGIPVAFLHGGISNSGGVVYLDIHTVFVIPTHQRQGLGRSLLLQARERGKAAGADMVFLTVFTNNPAAIKLYESAGLRPARIDMVDNL